MTIRLKNNSKPDLRVADVLRATDGTVEAARFNLEQKGFFFIPSPIFCLPTLTATPPLSVSQFSQISGMTALTKQVLFVLRP